MDVTKPYEFIGVGANSHLRVVNVITIMIFMRRFPAEFGPEARSNGSGFKNGAERKQN